MNNIDKLKKMNITFNSIYEDSASKIMQEEYSFSQLFKYVVLFEKYNKIEKSEQFVCLDFSHLYYLAETDMHFGQIIMSMYLSVENRIKCLTNLTASDIHLIVCEKIKNFLRTALVFLFIAYYNFRPHSPPY